MGHAAGQLADCLHLPRLQKLFLELLLYRNILRGTVNSLDLPLSAERAVVDPDPPHPLAFCNDANFNRIRLAGEQGFVMLIRDRQIPGMI